jgi:ABC-2 type transport system permease protein
MISRWEPFLQLTMCRIREFIREPEAIFWVYGFPLLMTLVLGIAFREKKQDEAHIVDIEEGPHAEFVQKSLAAEGPRFNVHRASFEECKKRLRKSETSLIVRNGGSAEAEVVYLSDPLRPESSLAQKAVDDVLQKAKGRKDVLNSKQVDYAEQGGRYIDFLVPGLLGMGLLGGGMFGVGFAIVDLRIRKLLKRFLATPMKRPDFLLAIMTSRFVFMIPEVVMLLLFAYFIFDVRIMGSVWLVIFCILLGGVTFSGIGLLMGCRAKTLEAASGLMNLVMLPMWVLSGVFFNANRYPEAVQPIIRALPLTLMNDALRAVMNEGASFWDISGKLLGLVAWGVVTFFIALKLFRWQ